MSRSVPTVATRHCVVCQRPFTPGNRNQFTCGLVGCPAPKGARLEAAVKAQVTPADAGTLCPCCWSTVPYRRRYCSDLCRSRRARASRWLVLSRDKTRRGAFQCAVCRAQVDPGALEVVRINPKLPRTAGNVVSMCGECLAVSAAAHKARIAALTQAARAACSRIELSPNYPV